MDKYILVHGIKIASDFVPETFGRLTTIGPRFYLTKDNNKRRYTYQVCQCSCGAIKVINHGTSSSLSILSCGCQQKEAAKQGMTTHGHSRTKEYAALHGLLYRCNNKNNKDYPIYGGRGIRVCDRWQEPNGQGYLNFLADMGPIPPYCNSVDRIDVNGDYCPENCRWATVIEQARNKRSNRQITAFGKTQCISAWAEEYNINKTTLRIRLDKNWPPERAIAAPSTPRKERHRKK